MQQLPIPAGAPTKSQLEMLESRCREARDRMKSPESEVRLPLFVEFAGSPKAGKSTIIGIVGHFLKRMKLEILQPAEGASIRTPPGLRDDWLSFNIWSGCYALQHILIDCSTDPPPDIVILDRGLFDAAGWFEFLCSSQKRIAEEDQTRITEFFTLDMWRRRENAVFLLTADHKTSLERETHDKLTRATGAVMNKDTLQELSQSYESAANRLSDKFSRLYHLDTSFANGKSPSFQQLGYVVAEKIVGIMEELSEQELLVTDPADFNGLVTDAQRVDQIAKRILADPRFQDRRQAEKTLDVQQVVPYGVLENDSGEYFWARRRSDVRRKELQGKYTILVGGHAEKRDWEAARDMNVFKQCLQRELDEELIGLQVLEMQPVGFINDTRNRMGAHHLAFIHRIRVGGKTLIRRQALDQEFGRESVSWRTPAEIKMDVSKLDPWSQLVAAQLFGAVIPNPTLFLDPNSSE